MNFGFVLPAFTKADEVLNFAITAENNGVESIWMQDHIILPKTDTKQYPYTEDKSFPLNPRTPILDPLVTLGFIASKTSKIKLGTSIIVLPYRNPLILAKNFSTLDILSNGRTICGIGVGWLKKEFDLLGVDYSNRGNITNKYIENIQDLWDKDKSINLDYTFEPKPIQKPSIPIWIGGNSKLAIRRAAKYGQAWHPTRLKPKDIKNQLPYLKSLLLNFGKTKESFLISLKRNLNITDLELPNINFRQSSSALSGTSKEIKEDIEYCKKIGIDQLTFDLPTTNIKTATEIIKYFMNIIIKIG
ncbi:MAG: hypothetical protein CL758_04870 [Chloroflexi bacterium]|nr:hypothetical protein [Chloroflexota bacterium]|tara:strand:- start:32637 stop:33542 length:906 start_codon:yes stop_codon:yes gene_type:complete